MNTYPLAGEKVKLVDSMLVPGLEYDSVGTVESRDGEYFYIKLDISGVVVERYNCEFNRI